MVHGVPHAVQGQPDGEARRRLWAESPLVDEYLGDLLLEAVAAQRLGTRIPPTCSR